MRKTCIATCLILVEQEYVDLEFDVNSWCVFADKTLNTNTFYGLTSVGATSFLVL